MVDDPEAPPNLSLEEPGTAARADSGEQVLGRGSSGLWLAYHRHVPVLRARAQEELLDGFVRLLADFELPQAPQDLKLVGSVIEGPQGTLMVIGEVAQHLPQLQSRIRRMGLRLLPGVMITVDSSTGELRIPSGPRALEEPLGLTPARTVRARGILTLVPGADVSTRARRVAAVVPSARATTAADGAGLLEQAVALCEAVEVRNCPAGDSQSVLSALESYLT